MSCLTCGSFDPNYHGGYCDHHKRDVSPSDTCSNEDSRGRSYESNNCGNCSSFDPQYHGGYCNFHSRDANASSTCARHTDR